MLENKNLAKPLEFQPSFKKTLIPIVLVSLILGTATGYVLSNKSSSTIQSIGPVQVQTPKTAQQDTKLCRDFAEGKIKVKPQPSDATQITEGTHLLERDGAYPVALTSSVIDLTQYENKKVKVFGETQKALKEGWLMDVCRVEESK